MNKQNPVERIKILRNDYFKCSQREFAEKIGFHQSHLSKVELYQAPLTDKFIDAICKNLNVNRSWLYGADTLPSNPDNSINLNTKSKIDKNIKKTLNELEKGFLQLSYKKQQIILDLIHTLIEDSKIND